MAKKHPARSSPPLMPVMIVGALVVIALLTFSLRRMASSRNAASTQTSTPATTTAAAPAGTTAAEPQHSADLDKVARIKPQELRDKIARNEVTVIDVRDAQSFLSSHIPGALHIPMTRLDGEIPYLPKDKPIVTYCT